MATPKGMRAQKIPTASGDAVHVYSDRETIILQLRREVASEVDLLSPSCKVAVQLSDAEALAIAGELLAAVAARMKAKA